MEVTSIPGWGVSSLKSEPDYDIQGVMAVRGFVRDGHSDGPSRSAAGSNGSSLP